MSVRGSPFFLLHRIRRPFSLLTCSFLLIWLFTIPSYPHFLCQCIFFFFSLQNTRVVFSLEEQVNRPIYARSLGGLKGLV